MLELSESLNNESKIEENDDRFPEWDFDRSFDGIKSKKPYRQSVFSRRESHTHITNLISLKRSQASQSNARRDSMLSDCPSNIEPYPEDQFESARQAMSKLIFNGKTYPFDYSDPIFSRSEPINSYEALQNVHCSVCQTSLRKNQRTFCKFCGNRCCRGCALHKMPIPYKKEVRSQICDLCNAKFNLLKLRQDVKHSTESEQRAIQNELEKGRTTLEQMQSQNSFLIRNNELISQHLQASTREYKQLVSHKDEIQKVTEDRSNQLVDRNLYLKQIQNELSMQSAEEKFLISKLTKAEKNSKNRKKKKNLRISEGSSTGLFTDDQSVSARQHLLNRNSKFSDAMSPPMHSQPEQSQSCCRCIIY